MEMKRALAVLLVIMTVLYCAACGGQMTALRYKAEYRTPEELEELYDANKEAFDKVAGYFLESDEMLEAMRAANEPDWGIYGAIDHKKVALFTEEQRDEITALCDTVKPYMIMRCRKISDIVYFVFPTSKYRKTDLFYLPGATDEVIDFYDRYGSFSEDDECSFYEIGDDWWILDIQYGERYKEFAREQNLGLLSHMIDLLRGCYFLFD